MRFLAAILLVLAVCGTLMRDLRDAPPLEPATVEM